MVCVTDYYSVWHKIGSIPHKIDTHLPFSRKSPYVKLSMLKRVSKWNNGQ